jgi:hypothetical protein
MTMREKAMEEVLRWLDLRGGLGFDAHDRITAALAMPSEPTAPRACCEAASIVEALYQRLGSDPYARVWCVPPDIYARMEKVVRPAKATTEGPYTEAARPSIQRNLEGQKEQAEKGERILANIKATIEGPKTCDVECVHPHSDGAIRPCGYPLPCWHHPTKPEEPRLKGYTIHFETAKPEATAGGCVACDGKDEFAAELLDLLEDAWGVIANAGWRNESKTTGWDEAAARWHDRYHEILGESVEVRRALAQPTKKEG